MTKMEKIQNSSSDKDLTFFNISITFGHISFEFELGGSEYRRLKPKSLSLTHGQEYMVLVRYSCMI